METCNWQKLVNLKKRGYFHFEYLVLPNLHFPSIARIKGSVDYRKEGQENFKYQRSIRTKYIFVMVTLPQNQNILHK